MRIDVLTLFPAMFSGVLGESIARRAADAGAVSYHLHDIREHTTDKHGKVDQPPFGGGPGMVMQCQPVWDCVEHVEQQAPDVLPTRLLMTPQGRPLDQPTVERLAGRPRLLLIAGHYEGLDERVVDAIRQRPGGLEEVSLGDYVLSGGELPAMVVIDAVVRLLPGVLGHERSAHHDSFSAGSQHLLDHPHYTRPRKWSPRKWPPRKWTPRTGTPETGDEREVPDVLLTGDHAKIDAWRAEQRKARTAERRPDLLGPGREPRAAMCVVLRDETRGDAPAIREVHRAAFDRSTEADLVDELRRRGDAIVSLVAEVDTPRGGELVGHAMLSGVTLAEQPGIVGYVGLAPIGVRPPWQGRGIGAALVRRLLDRARKAAVRGVFVLGEPAFYRRFGFTPAAEHGFSSRFAPADGEAAEHFMVLPLRDIDPHHTGAIRYAAAIEALADGGASG